MVSTAPSIRSLIDTIKDDHAEASLSYYYEQYLKAASIGDVDGQERWSNQLRWGIARHSTGEELVVYPLIEKTLGEEGKRIADGDRADHQTVKEFLYKLEGMKIGSEGYGTTLKTMMDTLRKHIAEEERDDLPQLESALSREGSQDAAKSFLRTKKFAPTRSHPSAPDKPPFETLAGFMAAPIDKLKDAFAKFPTEEMKRNA